MVDEFALFMDSFYRLTGIDLKRYKRPQMERRLTHLRDRRGYKTFADYFDALITDNAQLDELLDKMTINVSEFFRNRDRWDQLMTLLSSRKDEISAWSAACSTGEEPYSLAMLLMRHQMQFRPIYATDIDDGVLQSAKCGTYEFRQLRHADQWYVERYFDSDGTNYVVKPHVRECVQFEKHNLLSDPYPSNVDLIICRNVLIYFTDSTKELILNRFSRSLRPGGLLFVGSTEQFFGLDLPDLKLVSPFIYEKQVGVHV